MDNHYTLELGEKYDFTIDMSSLWPNDTINNVVWEISSDSIIKSNETNTDTTATVWLERIAAGTNIITATITSSSSPARVEVLTFRIFG